MSLQHLETSLGNEEVARYIKLDLVNARKELCDTICFPKVKVDNFTEGVILKYPKDAKAVYLPEVAVEGSYINSLNDGFTYSGGAVIYDINQLANISIFEVTDKNVVSADIYTTVPVRIELL